MRGWSDEAQWVIDEDGLRWYFSERNPGGPSRLECYRRLLGQPEGSKQHGAIASFWLTTSAATLRRLADMLEFVVFAAANASLSMRLRGADRETAG